MTGNFDNEVIDDFGKEWKTFDQTELTDEESELLFQKYFSKFPWEKLPTAAVGADFGCGSGRWAKHVADKAGKLICVDASQDAMQVAKNTLKDNNNCEFILSPIGSDNIEDNSLDFAYSLGVLHHIPDTGLGIKSCVKRLKSGAPFLVYLYYAFDNRPLWFILLWKVSDKIRLIISKLPFKLKSFTTNIIAAFIYYPLAKLSFILDKAGMDVRQIPLSSYKESSFYTMRTDALDRFGTKLEKRFTQQQITNMLDESGIINIEFNKHAPYWCAIGYKK